ncbi:MAG: hypothetical protein BGO59_26560 [Spirosoma sp. 48-14]|nr:MAG: hypothetical protein BGO59_26560 [Spirosoma sp. 48-14]
MTNSCTAMKLSIYLTLCFVGGLISLAHSQPKPAAKTKTPVKSATAPVNRPDNRTRYAMKGEKMESRPSVGVLAKAIGHKLYLRWVPTMQSYWEFGYRDGYVVERVNVKTRQRVVINSNVMPKPAADWQPFIDRKDRNYSVLYAAIYEQPEFSGEAITQMNERIQLFHFALLGADMDFKAACMAGLGLIDSTAVQGERYQYVIGHKSAARYKLLSVVSSEVGLGDTNPMPAIRHFAGRAGDRVANLFAETASVRSTYNQYQIERSEDGEHFASISSLPFIVTNKLDTLTVSDTLDSDEITYQYRIRGLTLFQEVGPYSNNVRIKAKSTLPVPAFYSVNETTDKNKLEVQWLYKDSLSQYIDHYQLVGATEQGGPFAPISEIIPANQRMTYIKPLTPARGYTFFIKLITHLKKGDVMETLAYPVTLADDDPPVQPQGLTGKIERKGELGIVTLSWQPNPDTDLYGYFVNRRDKAGQRYYRVNNEFIKQTTLTDTIRLQQMQRYVFYTVKALDLLFKESVDSKALVLRIPDINPPTSPIIDSFTVTDKRIFLHWTRSHSEDVQKHILYRKKMPNANWEELLTITDTLTQAYTDSSVAEKSLYAYTVIAFDDSQNRSQPATPVVLETPFFTRNVDFSQFTSAVVDTTRQTIRLTWACNQTDKIDNFLIYRAMPDDELALVKKVEGDSREWIDYVEMLPNKPYRYVIRARMQEGYLSGWKETVIERKP